MKILAIETSCDETAAAVVENGKKIIANVVASSKKLHQKTGGIIPEVAAREQVKCILPVIKEAIYQSKNKIFKRSKHQNETKEIIDYLTKEIDALAVTVGPGLIGSLLIGVETAKTMAYVTNKPIVPVNHLLAHLYANWLTNVRQLHSTLRYTKVVKKENQEPSFPAVALVVSGGHTELFLIEDHGKCKWIGGTLDDAAGECFDKTARILGLGFPGGPAIAVCAAKIRNSKPKMEKKIKLPRPMINSRDLNFSFSGLKTAVIRETNKLKAHHQFDAFTISQLAYEIEEAITDVLVKKTLDAAKKYAVKSILLGGGVAANQRLKEKFKIQNEKCKMRIFIPPPFLCTDNAAYIGSYAYFNYKPVPWQKIQADPNLEVAV